LQFIRRYRELVLVAALLTGALLAVGTGGRVELGDGFLYDVALAVAPLRASSAMPKVVVVAVDQKSLSSPLLEATPRVFFGPYYAELLDGLFAGGAKAVGFDIIFAYAASRFGAIDRNYDSALLAALERQRERVVLARTEETRVAEPFGAVVFDAVSDAGREEPAAIGYAELIPSEDGVQRWIFSEYLTNDGTKLQTLAARLAAIGGKQGYADPFLLAPATPLESLPTYALVDVLNCIETSPDTIRTVFADKVVLVGSNLPEEDRKRAPDRFLRWPAQRSAPAAKSGDCELLPLGASAPDSDSVPGVHIHAAATDSLLSGTGVRLVPTPGRVVAAASAAVICASLGLYLAPLVAVAAFVGFIAALFSVSVIGISAGQWLPIAIPASAGLCALLGGQLARYLAQDRRQQRLQSAFGCYLAPAIVSQLADEEVDLQLGGEERDITVMFADLTNFTAISDTMAPRELMELTNRYFKVIVEVIDGTGGYVDKFIGDSVMALWGAPAAAADAPARALKSALLIQQRVQSLKSDGARRDLAGFDVKMGISSGPAIVGNVGAPRRVSYTALGATINLAARLEKVCSTFGCRIVVDSTTMEAVRDRYLFCELDSVSLKGKRYPVAAYEAISPIEQATPQQREYVARYQAALQCYRAGELDRAAKMWAELESATPDTLAPKVMAQRARTGEPIATAYLSG
jgi:adenylate cyclase